MTLASRLLNRYRATPDRIAVSYLASSGAISASLTYRDLVDGARQASTVLRAHEAQGAPVLILARAEPAFLQWFFGCLLAGAVPVPAPPATGRHRLERLRLMAADAGASLVVGRLTEGAAEVLPGLRVIAPDEHLAVDPERCGRSPASDVAMLQYTSGSTANPRGVVLTNEGILHNVGQIAQGFGLGAEDRAVIWLPPHHDMGLIGGLLTPVLTGFPTMVIDPAAFARSPLLWPEVLSRHRATVSGGPNTAYELVARELERAGPGAPDLDLSAWRVAFVGAEPVSAATLHRFSRAAARHGFDQRSLRPCYGLAEATLLVACADGRGPRTSEATGAVVCGAAVAETRVRVVDRDGRLCPPGGVGEIWVSGPGVGAGYRGGGAETDRTFGGRLDGDPLRYLRTGDLGYLDERGDLVPTGRLKDLIIVNGRNVYPADLELAAMRAAEPSRCGLAAAFALTADDEFAVLVEVAESGDRVGEVLRRVQAAVLAEADRPPAIVAAVRMATLPRTTSGKIQRSRARTQFLAGDLQLSGRLDPGAQHEVILARMAALRAELTLCLPAERAEQIAAYLVSRLTSLGYDGLSDQATPLSASGVDSITRLTLVEELELLAGDGLTRSQLLSADSVAALAAVVAQGFSASPPAEPVASVEVGRWHPATPAEAAMVVLESRVPGGTTITVSGETEGRWEACALHRAVAALVERHESLRTRYRVGEAGVLRRVEASAEASPVVTVDGVGWSDERRDRWLRDLAAEPFDLGATPLLRVRLLERGARGRLVALSVPHVVADFRSLTVLLTDLFRAMTGLPLPRPPAPFRAHVERVERYLASPPAHAALDAAEARIRGVERRLRFPAPVAAGDGDAGAADEVRTVVGEACLRRAEELARQEGTSLFVVLLAVYQAVLHHHTGQASLTVGVPVLGREGAAFAETVGLFMNQVPVVSRPHQDATLRDLVRAGREEIRIGLEHQLLPLERVAARLPEARGEVFETMFVHHRTGPGQPAELAAFEVTDGVEVRLGGLNCRSVVVPRVRETLPLTVISAVTGGHLHLVFRYLRARIGRSTAERLAHSFATLSLRLLDDPDQAFRAVDPTGTNASEPEPAPSRPRRPESLVDRLADVVHRYPGRPALRTAAGRLSYQEVWDRAGAAAAALAAAGIGRGDLVAVLHARDPDTVLLTMAILRAGAGYVHLDSGSPPERLRTITAQGPVRVLVADDTNLAAARILGVDVLPATQLLRRPAATVTLPHARADDVAYVSYTSGSSGRPKGVVVPHAAALAGVDAFADVVGLGPGDVVANVSSASWDITVGDLLAAPMRGATLCLAPDEALLDGRALTAFLEEHRVSVLATTPHRWALLMEAGWRPQPGFRAVCGGDVMPATLAHRFRRLGVHAWNFYGPTETVLWATALDLRTWSGGESVPIGRPLPGYRVRPVNGLLAPVPPGTPGELLIGGPAVARGYLDDSRSTAGSFVPELGGGQPGARLYRTGDLVMLDEDDNLCFLGRIDDQVKLRGYRIETGDVEAALTALPAVASAVVGVVGEGMDAELVAVVSPDGGGIVEPRHLLRDLAGRLPRYMIPTRVVVQDQLPLTANGKIDRRTLARLLATVSPDSHDEPMTVTERVVADVLSEVLAEPRNGAPISPDDDFFLSGGHSLLAVRAAGRLSVRVGVIVPVAVVFERPTVRGLAAYLDEVRGTTAAGTVTTSTVRTGEPGPVGAVTAGQRRLWFEELAGAGSGPMVLPFLVEVRGHVRQDVLGSVFDLLVERHESLRSVIRTVDGEPRQELGAAPRLVVVELPEASPERARDQARERLRALSRQPAPMDRGPLVRAECLVSGPDHGFLVLVANHLVFDGASARALLEEFRVAYERMLRDEPPDLPPLPMGEHEAARRLAAGRPSATAIDAVVDRLVGVSRLRLPEPAAGHPAPARKCSAELADAAHRAARRFSTTPYTVVTAAVLTALRASGGQGDLLTGLDVAARDDELLDNLVGYFGNQLPLRVNLADTQEYEEIIARTAQAITQAIDHQSVTYDVVVAELRRRGALPLGHDLFEVKIAHEVVPRSPVTGAGFTLQVLDTGWASEAFPLALWVWEDTDSVLLELHHRWDACPPDWADELLDDVRLLVRSMASGGDRPPAEWVRRASAPAFDDVPLRPVEARRAVEGGPL